MLSVRFGYALFYTVVEDVIFLIFIIMGVTSFFFYIKNRNIGHFFSGIGFLLFGTGALINQYLTIINIGSLSIDSFQLYQAGYILFLLVATVFILIGIIFLYKGNKTNLKDAKCT